jgi:hypothetical protein
MSEEKINIFQKLQKSRVELQQKKIKKSGKNTYSNYEYFELGDFLPAINEICLKNGISPIFHFSNELATLTIFDADNTESTLVFETPIDIASLKGCNNIQNIGGTQTYARRYLYMMAFEIAESDFIDSGAIQKDDDGPNVKIDSMRVSIIQDLVEKTNTNLDEFLKWVKVKSIEDITNKKFVMCMQQLNKKLEKIEKESKEVTPTDDGLTDF